jgi:hypothetical protein
VSKKLVFGTLLFSISAFVIVLPVIRSVNVPGGNPVLAAPNVIADGDPMPPPHRPCCSAVDSLVPDGDPMPPPHRPPIVS